MGLEWGVSRMQDVGRGRMSDVGCSNAIFQEVTTVQQIKRSDYEILTAK